MTGGLGNPKEREEAEGGERFEYRMWLLRQTHFADDIEAELNRLNRDHGWRCVGFVPTNVLANDRVGGYFLLERPGTVATGEQSTPAAGDGPAAAGTGSNDGN